jgi:hypothetical protein
MGSFAEENRTFFYNLKRYGLTLSRSEIQQTIISILVIAFVWSFDKWGSDKFDVVMGLQNFLFGALFAAIAMFLNQIGQRFVAVHYGYDPVYEFGILGIMIALIISFASRGLLIFFLPGAINIRHLAASRLGEFRYYTNDWEWAKAGFMGPMLNIIAAIILSLFRANPLMRQLMIMNILFAAYSLIPMPGNLGLYLFYPHIYLWSFTVAFVAAATLMVFFLTPLYTFLLSLGFAVYALYWHYLVKDQNLRGTM